MGVLPEWVLLSEEPQLLLLLAAPTAPAHLPSTKSVPFSLMVKRRTDNGEETHQIDPMTNQPTICLPTATGSADTTQPWRQRSPYGCDFRSFSPPFFQLFFSSCFFLRRSQPSSTSSSLPTAPTCLPCRCSCSNVEGGSLISRLVCVCTPPPLSWKTELLRSSPASQL